MRNHTRWIAAVCSLSAWLIVAAAPLRADEAGDDAKKHFFAGEAFYAASRFEEAIEEFKAANKIRSHSAFLYNIGVTYEAMGDLEEAITWLEKYVTDVERVEEKSRVGKKIAALRVELKEIPPPETGPAPTPTEPPKKRKKGATKKILEVVTTPPGAALWIDKKEGEPRTRTPEILEMNSGEHIVFLELEDYGPLVRKVNIEAARPWVVLDITLIKKEALGFVTIVSDKPGSRIYIDDRDAGVIGRTPYKDWITIGTHHIWVEKEGYETIEADIDIGSGETPSFEYKMKIAHYGRLVVKAARGALVEVDGKVLATVPVPSPAPRLATGSHSIRVKAKGKKPFKGNIVIDNGKTLTLEVDLKKRRSYVGPIVAFGLAAGFGTTGLIFALRSKSKLSAIEDDVAAGMLVDSRDPRNVKARIDAIVADAGFGLAVITALVGTISLVRDKTPPSAGKIISSKFAAAPLPEGGGLVTFSGGF